MSTALWYEPTIGFRRMLLFSYHNETLSCSCRLSETLKRQKDTKTSKMGLDSWHQLLFSLMSTEKEWGYLKREAVGKERNLSEGEEWRFSKKNPQPWTRWCTSSHYTSMETEKQRERECVWIMCLSIPAPFRTLAVVSSAACHPFQSGRGPAPEREGKTQSSSKSLTNSYFNSLPPLKAY